MQIDTVGREFRPAPYQSVAQTTGSINGAWASPGEEVQWIWTHTPTGSYISGYEILPKFPTLASGSDRLRKDRDWGDYPLGTKAHAYNGGYWIRVSNGWKWSCGDTFPTPGGDAIGACVELPNKINVQVSQ
jgi:hypothetical protein